MTISCVFRYTGLRLTAIFVLHHTSHHPQHLPYTHNIITFIIQGHYLFTTTKGIHNHFLTASIITTITIFIILPHYSSPPPPSAPCSSTVSPPSPPPPFAVQYTIPGPSVNATSLPRIILHNKFPLAITTINTVTNTITLAPTHPRHNYHPSQSPPIPPPLKTPKTLPRQYK